jgi:thiamine biosynthesis lipoprotein
MTTGMTRRQALGLIASAPLLSRAASAREAGAEDLAHIGSLSGQAFGTGWQVTAAPGADLAEIASGIAGLFSGIDSRFSPYRPDSLISRFNAAPAGARLSDASLLRVTQAALEVAQRSEGAFDPTVGPLVARWGFGPITGGGAPNWRGLIADHRQVTKSGDELTLDLCGIAKGWALDEAARVARAHGVHDFLFDLGGELVAQGQHPSGRDWRVAVEPAAPGQPSPAILRLPSQSAVATSGITAQSYRLDRTTYGHIIDPRRAIPAQGRLRSVSVVAEDAMTADGWATALFAAGDTAGPEMARALGLAALFVFEGAETRHTPALAGFLI